MLETDYDARLSSLKEAVYARLASLRSKLNSRIPGGPLATLIAAFSTILSDAWEDLFALLAAFNPKTATGATQKDVLGFFGLTSLSSVRSTQAFTLFRTDATEEKTISAGATIQTKRLQSGRILTYRLVGPGAVMAAGQAFIVLDFQSVEPGLVTTLTGPQEMEVASGASGVYVASGRWSGSSTPLSTMTGTFSQWLSLNASSIVMAYTVQGRDAETDEEFYNRCVARWDAESTGSTAAAYEGWCIGYIAPDTGDSPVVAARVTENQVYASTSTWPASQKPSSPADGTTFTMGVEIAIALRSGTAPTPEFLQLLGEDLLPRMPHNDRVWFRAPNMVEMGAGSVAITMTGPARFSTLARQVATSFFLYDDAFKENYRGLGRPIYRSDIVHAIRGIDPSIVDAKVVFTPPVLVPPRIDGDGDLELLPFDQISMPLPVDAVTLVIL